MPSSGAAQQSPLTHMQATTTMKPQAPPGLPRGVSERNDAGPYFAPLGELLMTVGNTNLGTSNEAAAATTTFMKRETSATSSIQESVGSWQLPEPRLEVAGSNNKHMLRHFGSSVSWHSSGLTSHPSQDTDIQRHSLASSAYQTGAVAAAAAAAGGGGFPDSSGMSALHSGLMHSNSTQLSRSGSGLPWSTSVPTPGLSRESTYALERIDAILNQPGTNLMESPAALSLSASQRRIPIESLLNPVQHMSLDERRGQVAPSAGQHTGMIKAGAGMVAAATAAAAASAAAPVPPGIYETGSPQTAAAAAEQPPNRLMTFKAGRINVPEDEPSDSRSVQSGPSSQSGAQHRKQEALPVQQRLMPGESETVRRFWTKEEDEQLMFLISKHGPRRWEYIASLMENRTGQQIRLRYNNHLRFSAEEKQGNFTPAQDKMILEEGKSTVRRWSVLAKRINKSHNSVKNRYHVLIRRKNRLEKLQSELMELQAEKD